MNGNLKADVFIYVLLDPLTMMVRYVGKTIKPTKERLQIHIASSRYYPRRHVCHWINSLINNGLDPIIEIIDVVTEGKNWQGREQYWIEQKRKEGFSLTNLTEGGEGWHGLHHTEETKKKISEGNKGKKIGDSQREKQRASMVGRKLNEDHRLKSAETLRKVRLTEKWKKAVAKQILINRKSDINGEGNPNSKLTEEDVLEIRQSTLRPCELGRKYGISPEHAQKIRKGKAWNHIQAI